MYQINLTLPRIILVSNIRVYVYIMTCMLVLSGRVELMVMHGGVKNNYEHNVVVMNLPLCPQTADDANVSLVNELQISNVQKLVTAYFLSAS